MARKEPLAHFAISGTGSGIFSVEKSNHFHRRERVPAKSTYLSISFRYSTAERVGVKKSFELCRHSDRHDQLCRFTQLLTDRVR